MNPPVDDHQTAIAECDPASNRILRRNPDPPATSEDDRPFNLSMYLDFLHGTD